MEGLIPPHGGVLVHRTVTGEAADALRDEAKNLVKVPVSDADLSSVYRFGDGALSPLTGPMDFATYNRVFEESVIEHDGQLYA